jgi:hypothetical protein
MSRQIGVVLIGVVLAVAVIFALFDERVSFKNSGTNSRVTQSQPPSN